MKELYSCPTRAMRVAASAGAFTWFSDAPKSQTVHTQHCVQLDEMQGGMGTCLRIVATHVSLHMQAMFHVFEVAGKRTSGRQRQTRFQAHHGSSES